MNRFTQYVLRQLIGSMLLVTISLTGIIWLSQSLRFVEMIVNQGVSLGTFIYLTLLMLPSFLTQILPISLFCIVIFIYAKLISDKELVIMEAAGQSQLNLSKPAIFISMGVVIIAYIINLYIMPESYRKFRELQWEIRNYSHIIFKEGMFTNMAGVTVYVRKRSTDAQLFGILAHDQRNAEKPETWMASKGAFVQTNTGAKFVMFNGNRQTIDPITKKISILYFDQGILNLSQLGDNASNPAWRHREARERPLKELLDAKELPDIDSYNIGKFTVEAHKRISSPFTALGFSMIGLAFLMTGNVARQSQIRPISASVLLVVSLLLSGLGIENLVSKNLELIPLLYFHSLAPIIVTGFFLLRRQRLNYINQPRIQKYE